MGTLVSLELLPLTIVVSHQFVYHLIKHEKPWLTIINHYYYHYLLLSTIITINHYYQPWLTNVNQLVIPLLTTIITS